MKPFLSALLFIVFSLTDYAQSAFKAPLKFGSDIIHLCVNKSGQLTLVSRMGDVAFANNIQAPWHKRGPASQRDHGALFGLTLDNAIFFNNDTGFISGLIGGGNFKDNRIYHTTDGGKSWTAINFGQDGWVNGVCSLDNGEAWMNVGGASGCGIAYTSDYGLTWKKLDLPDNKQRFAGIYFNTNKEGITGSSRNQLICTNDNGATWKALPTPLDQKKYNKTDKESRPAISQVAIFHDYYLVTQENMVFYSKRDNINWIFMPAYSNFYTDAENSALYFQADHGAYIRTNEKFQILQSYSTTINNIDAKCRNGNLYIISEDQVLQLKKDGSVISSDVYTDNESEIQPDYCGEIGQLTYGTIGNDLYNISGPDWKWKYILTLPFPDEKGKYTMFQDQLVFAPSNTDSVYYYHLYFRRIKRYSAATMIEDFCKVGVKKITFNKGSHGCFHFVSDNIVYTKKGNAFVTEGPDSSITRLREDSTRKNPITGYKKEIDMVVINRFLNLLPSISNKHVKFNELGFGDNDFKRLKEEILDFKRSLESKKKIETPFQFPVNNLDFTRLTALTDSVKSIDDKKLDHAMHNLSSITYSTTTGWVAIKLVNANDEELTIRHTFYEPNAYYFPWEISLNGYTATNTAIEINNFINETFPSFLDKQDKMKVLYTLVKEIY